MITSRAIHVAVNVILLYERVVSHCVCAVFSLSIHLSVDIYIVFMSWLL